MCQCHHHSSCGCQGQSCSCGCHQAQGGCQKSCGCSSQGGSCGCQKNQCGCGCKHCGCDHATKFLELANQAWMEVLKEKIKEHIQKQSKHMDELAGLIAEANHERWKTKMENQQCCGGFKERLKNFFDQACQSGQKGSSPQGSSSNKQR
jgi:hypothetical protein